MLQKKVEFSNPNNLPLNELSFQIKENGVQIKIPALSEHWIDKNRCFSKYRALILVDGKLQDNLFVDEWLNEADYFNKDMEHLLQLKHFEFWSTLVFNNHSIESIISFLQESTPFYFNLKALTTNSKILNIYKQLLNNVLRIICRMITNKESEGEWITKEHLSELLYTKFLISIPMIFDLLIAYGKKNLSILKKIIDTIFVIEPKYFNDLELSLKFYQKSLKTVQNKVENDESDEEITTLDDLALFTLDCGSTLCLLLEICPKAKLICNEINMEISVTNFYENTIPLLYKNIFTVNPDSDSLEYLNRARLEFLKIFNSLIQVYVENILKDPKQSIIPSEKYLGILTECLADRTFVADYQKYFPIDVDIEILKQACKDLDMFKVDFILKAYTSEGKLYMTDVIHEENYDRLSDNINDFQLEENRTEEIDVNFNGKNDVCVNRDIDKEIVSVQDILPHLGDGFIRKLLTRYENPELCIAAVLEGNLPPDLSNADQSEIFIPDDPRDTLYKETGIERYNIFDGDQYDIMTRDNPNCIIKSGKGFPGQPKNLSQLLDDKSHVRALKERYQEYSLITENDNEYDDEYDDSYDAMADSESKAIKPQNINKNVLVDEVEDSSTSDESSPEEINDGRDRTKDFCENPEIIRARYEAQRQAKFGNKTYNQKPSNLTGKPKGQGQDKKVVQDRHKKDVHKSSRANHSRKSGAAFKRNRGMIPS